MPQGTRDADAPQPLFARRPADAATEAGLSEPIPVP